MEPDDEYKMLDGIQADDEDNDQIETERAVDPSERRKQELNRVLALQNKGAPQQTQPSTSAKNSRQFSPNNT